MGPVRCGRACLSVVELDLLNGMGYGGSRGAGRGTTYVPAIVPGAFWQVGRLLAARTVGVLETTGVAKICAANWVRDIRIHRPEIRMMIT